jgi:DNA-binding response OmpR family regulator
VIDHLPALIAIAVVAVFAVLPEGVQFGVTAVISVLCIAGNAGSAVGAALRRGRTSFVPLLGGVTGVVAMRVAPWPELAAWAWLPLVLDLGTSLVAVGLVVAIGRSVFRRRPRRVQPMRILLVENHPTFAATVTTTFLAAHRVQIVATIGGAIRAITQSRFDVALVDHDLDDGKGDELVRWMRRSAKHLAIVAISAHDEHNATLVAAGADAACSKLQFSRIEEVLQRVRPDGGQTGFRWRLARSDRLRGRTANARLEDRLVAAVLMFMAEHEVDALVVRELDIKSADVTLAIADRLDADAVADTIRMCLRDQLWCRLEAGELAIHVGRLYLYVESQRDCPRALDLAIHDFELAVEPVQDAISRRSGSGRRT